MNMWLVFCSSLMSIMLGELAIRTGLKLWKARKRWFKPEDQVEMMLNAMTVGLLSSFTLFQVSRVIERLRSDIEVPLLFVISVSLQLVFTTGVYVTHFFYRRVQHPHEERRMPH